MITDVSVRAAAAKLFPETVVAIVGTVVASTQAPAGVELHAPEITVLGESAAAPPFEMRRAELGRADLGPQVTDEPGESVVRTHGQHHVASLAPALSLEELGVAQAATERVTVADKLMDYVLAIVGRTRNGKDLLLGVSPRGAQGFYRAVQARALVSGRPYATPDDVKRVAVPTLAHRVLASQPGAWDGGGSGRRERDAVQRILDETPVPL